jgi:5'-3' exonuclease
MPVRPQKVRPLLVVDAPYLLFRAFFALPKTITDDAKRPVNALLGTLNTVLQVGSDHDPRAVVLCFGPDAAPYRVELYSAYHADRPPVPDELAWQFEQAPVVFGAFGWTTLYDETLEADDLLYTLAAAERKAGGRALLLTGDRDLFQCASDAVTVLYLRPGRRGAEAVDPSEVERRYGVPPELVPDFIALRGDPSDGLPGAPGIGEKTAAELLRRHGSLEGAIAGALRERSPRVRGALRDGADALRAFKEVATLRRAKNVRRPPDRPTDLAGGAKAARSLGMKRLAERLEQAGAGARSERRRASKPGSG